MLQIGVIADDFTGATDIAGFLVAAGLRTVQLTGLESNAVEALDADAVVISLKTRSIPADDAVSQSLEALRLLERLDARRIVFKYCSTFDSTPVGNIGPVADALLDALGETFTVVVPALPVNGRTVYQANLFVFDTPLHESGMRDHPVTPMTDANLIRLLEAQSAGRAVSIPFATVEVGVDAVRAALSDAKTSGARYAVVDTLTTAHLDTIGAAVADLRLITGGSGVGSGLARSLAPAAVRETQTTGWEVPEGPAVVLAGSTSPATSRQVEHYCAEAAHHRLDVERVLADADAYRAELTDWVMAADQGELAPLIFATDTPEAVRALQDTHGGARVSEAIETFFGDLAATLQARGVMRFIVAGGETSGAVTTALGVRGFEIGPLIAPGVPWTRALGSDIALALKSGNFGDEHFFRTAQERTAHEPPAAD